MENSNILAAVASRIYFGVREFERLSSELVHITDLPKYTLHEPLKKYFEDVPGWYEIAKRELEAVSQLGAEVLYWGHPDYPQHFLDLERPPLFLAIWGDRHWMSHKLLAVVGSRTPSQEALSWMDTELPYIAKKGAVIVSGGAYGIDQKAHAMSLRSQCPTVAFLPSGFNQIYPYSLREWIHPILKNGGALITEFLPGVRMQRHFFYQRNRLIAALSDLVFVVEARRKSGSLMTAGQALRIGRNICVLPSRPGDVNASGSLDLLCEGAWPVRDGLDLELLLGLASTKSRPKFEMGKEPTVQLV